MTGPAERAEIIVRFRLRADLRCRTWPDEPDAIVFNPHSGDTHHLNLLDRVALECLDEAGPLSAAELLAAVALAADVPADAELDRYLTALLAQFDELGLIERLS